MRAPRSTFCRLTVILIAVAASAGLWLTANAQVDLDSLEAAYIYNFTQFTEWPATYGGGTLAVCVNPHSELGVMLAKLEGRVVSGKTWSVKPIPADPGSEGCSVLIVDDSAAGTAMHAAITPDAPILIVRAAEAGESEGPWVVTLVREGDKLRFDIDNKEALRRHLSLSSKLLRLARNVS